MRVAAVQMVSGPSVAENLAAAAELMAQAAQKGAQLVVLPENFAVFGQGGQVLQGLQESAGEGPLLPFLAQQAALLGVWLVGGTLPLAHSAHGQAAPQNKAYAACCVFNPKGQLAARYDKIHLFDAGVSDAVGRYQESAEYAPGHAPVVCATPWAKLGLGVCYDLRFPEYFRLLSQAGAQVLVVPAAFVYTTGQAHWEVLLRARAIENQCFVVAANQGGQHQGQRRTWGQSLIVNPWGDIIAQQACGEGVVMADLPLEEQTALRAKMPVLSHRRF